MATGHPMAVIFSPIFITFTFTPLPTSGQDHLSLSLSVPYQPRLVYCHPEAVVFVTPLPQQDYVRSVIVTFTTFTFTPLPPSGQDHLSLSPVTYQPRRISCHPEAVTFVTLSLT